MKFVCMPSCHMVKAWVAQGCNGSSSNLLHCAHWSPFACRDGMCVRASPPSVLAIVLETPGTCFHSLASLRQALAECTLVLLRVCRCSNIILVCRHCCGNLKLASNFRTQGAAQVILQAICTNCRVNFPIVNLTVLWSCRSCVAQAQPSKKGPEKTVKIYCAKCQEQLYKYKKVRVY